MKLINLLARLVLGLIFFIFGLNGFLHFLEMPELPQAAQTFIGGLFSAPHFLYLLKGTEVICGFFLLTGILVPLSLVVLAPIVLNIFLFNVYLAPEGLLMGLLVLILEAYLGFFVYRESFKDILKLK